MRLCRSSDAAYFACGTILTTARSVAAYGKTALTHEQVLQRYQGVTPSQADELALLETVEQRMRSWRLNKWEFRVPVLLTQAEKETAQQQLHKIKTLVLDHAKTQELIDADLNRVCTDLGVTKDELRTKNRAWLQEKVADLRWKGEVAQAKKIREAFVRLESYGSRDFRYFERLCCVYGLAKLGTFDDAFSNMVVPSGDSVALDTSSPFQDLMGLLVRKYASLDIIFDFLGFNDLEGYRAALGRHMRLSLEGKYRSSTDGAAPTRMPKSRVLFQRNVGTADRELLYEFRNNAQSVASAGDASNGVADFVHVRGNDMTLITIASKNRWLRSRQVPHRKQLEGIGRRASFVLQIPLEQTRIRSLFLPPSYVDRASLDRIHSSVLGLRSEQVSALAPWTDLYTKELDVARDADYAEIARAKPEEEWVML